MAFTVQEAGEPTNILRLIENQQISFSVSGTPQQSDQLPFGGYDVWCDETDIYIKVATTADDVTTSTGYKVNRGNVVPVLINANYRLGVVTSGASGTVRLHRTAS